MQICVAVVQNLFLTNLRNDLYFPQTSTLLIKRPKIEHSLEKTNKNNSSQVLEPDIDLQMTSYNSENETETCELIIYIQKTIA